MGTLNFGLHEFECPCPCTENHTKLALLEALQVLRDSLHVNDKIVIVSGYRCLEHNRSIGSKDTSSHVKGVAADISINNSSKAFRVLEGIFKTGAFSRVGFGSKNGKLHLHVDIDPEKVDEVAWGY